MPDGWIKIMWKDKNNKKWSASIPNIESLYLKVIEKIVKSGGTIIKTQY